ncbi:universal stress protein [Streptomyces sp. GC420]|uniref:universal stress protein n=1 Tax=Streptomyces sp. GC420 TaxID=2697568 RepID=UPI0014150682|nr:universal stress protein [Streptomyces sp. GC420]NBM19745.1 universal stress protein [Streptomyces sp. GC420]
MAGPIVVGMDGTRESLAAAEWAADEAAVRRLPVLLLHSWTSQPLDPTVPQAAASKQRYGQEVLRRAEAELRHHHPDLTVTTELVRDPAPKALEALSGDASLLVLGSRAHSALAGFLLGSTGLHVLGRASCPAVAVRPPRAGRKVAADTAATTVPADAASTALADAAGEDRDEVVVGLHDLSPNADPLLGFAFAFASLHGARVRAVRARSPLALLPHSPDAALFADAHERFGTQEHGRLDDVLAPWREKFPGLTAVGQIEIGGASEVLLSAASRARLLVVGRRLHHPPMTWTLGPVAHAALHHARCPVAVVPHA